MTRKKPSKTLGRGGTRKSPSKLQVEPLLMKEVQIALDDILSPRERTEMTKKRTWKVVDVPQDEGAAQPLKTIRKQFRRVTEPSTPDKEEQDIIHSDGADDELDDEDLSIGKRLRRRKKKGRFKHHPSKRIKITDGPCHATRLAKKLCREHMELVVSETPEEGEDSSDVTTSQDSKQTKGRQLRSTTLGDLIPKMTQEKMGLSPLPASISELEEKGPTQQVECHSAKRGKMETLPIKNPEEKTPEGDEEEIQEIVQENDEIVTVELDSGSEEENNSLKERMEEHEFVNSEREEEMEEDRPPSVQLIEGQRDTPSVPSMQRNEEEEDEGSYENELEGERNQEEEEGENQGHGDKNKIENNPEEKTSSPASPQPDLRHPPPYNYPHRTLTRFPGTISFCDILLSKSEIVEEQRRFFWCELRPEDEKRVWPLEVIKTLPKISPIVSKFLYGHRINHPSREDKEDFLENLRLKTIGLLRERERARDDPQEKACRKEGSALEVAFQFLPSVLHHQNWEHRAWVRHGSNTYPSYKCMGNEFTARWARSNDGPDTPFSLAIPLPIRSRDDLKNSPLSILGIVYDRNQYNSEIVTCKTKFYTRSMKEKPLYAQLELMVAFLLNARDGAKAPHFRNFVIQEWPSNQPWQKGGTILFSITVRRCVQLPMHIWNMDEADQFEVKILKNWVRPLYAILLKKRKNKSGLHVVLFVKPARPLFQFCTGWVSGKEEFLSVDNVDTFLPRDPMSSHLDAEPQDLPKPVEATSKALDIRKIEEAVSRIWGEIKFLAKTSNESLLGFGVRDLD